MARESSDREDLLRDAVGIPHRIEFRMTPDEPSIVIGFRTNGAASIYWGQDEHFQFNTAGQLRRAYWQEQLVKADRGKLITMRREQQAGQTVLISRQMEQHETTHLLERIRGVMRRLTEAIASRELEIVGVVSEENRDVLSDADEWLKKMAGAIAIANRPNVT